MPFRQFPLSLFGPFFPHNSGTTLRDLLKTNGDIASQSRRILQTFVSIVVGLPRTQTSLSLDENVRAKEGGKPEEETGNGPVRAPHHSNVCKMSRFCGAISSLAFNAISPFKLG